MDNLAHTLVGAVIGRALGADRVPAAGWIGAIAANAPDWTEPLVGLPFLQRGTVSYYQLHRGITHSFLGAAIEAAILVLIVAALQHWWTRRRGINPPPLGVLTTLIVAAVLSHLYMDWQGSYGLRPFLPWSGRWYYADWVAIVDPFFWVIPLIAIAWGSERDWRPLTPILLIVLITGWLIATRGDVTARWIQFGYASLLVIGAVGWQAHWFGFGRRSRIAVAALMVLALYAGAQAVVGAGVKAAIRGVARARFGPGAESAALTRIGTPFQWDPIYASRDTVAGPDWAVPRQLADPRVQIAMRTPQGEAIADWARFLAAEIDPSPQGTVVVLRDLRYTRPPYRGWAVVSIPLPAIHSD